MGVGKDAINTTVQATIYNEQIAHGGSDRCCS